MSKFIIEVRTKGFGKAEANLKKASGQTRQFAREANNASGAGAVFRKEVSQLRNNMLLYTFAIGGTIAALGKFVMAASTAREQQSKFNVVFGEFAPEAQKFAQSISDSFGIAESEMVKLLAGLQDTFVPLGFSRKEASKLSQSIAQLALDVGSFNDIATGDVARRFTSAIVGNHEAVRELGINMTEASLKAKAQQLGLIQLGDEMTTTAKILSRLQILYDDTTDAQGDLIKTQDEFANKLRGVQGQFKTLAEQIGEFLMPAAEFALKLAGIAADGDRAKIVLLGVAGAFGVYGGSVALATIQQLRFNKAVGANAYVAIGTTFLLAVDTAMDAIENFANKTVAASFDVESLDELIQSYADNNLQLKGGLEEVAKAEKAAAEARQQAIEATEASETALRVRLAVMQEETELMKFAAKREAEGNNLITATEKALLDKIDALIAKQKVDKAALALTAKQTEAEQKHLDMMSKIKIANESSVSALQSNVAAEEFRLEVVDKIAKSLKLTAHETNFLRENLDLSTASISENGKTLILGTEQELTAAKGKISLAKSIIDTAQATLEYNNIVEQNTAAIERNKKATKKQKDEQDLFNSLLAQTNQGQLNYLSSVKNIIIESDLLATSGLAGQQVMQMLNEKMDELADPEKTAAIATFKNTFDGLESTQRANIQATIDYITANKEAFAVFGDVDLVLKKLQEDYDNVGESTKKTTKDMEDNFRKAAATINTMTSAIRVLKDEAADDDQQLKSLIQLVGSLMAQFGGPQGAAAGALLNLGAEFAIGHTGGLIHNNGIQRFATGGMVQGQDNVPILAQAGEFIMQRSAVQNIGVQNLADMNRGGSSGGVTVNISGNMIGNDEFVRDNLIPQIQKASKQNLA